MGSRSGAATPEILVARGRLENAIPAVIAITRETLCGKNEEIPEDPRWVEAEKKFLERMQMNLQIVNVISCPYFLSFCLFEISSSRTLCW